MALRRPPPEQVVVLEREEARVEHRQPARAERREQPLVAAIVARASGTSSGAPARTKSFCMSTTTSAGATSRSASGTSAATRGAAGRPCAAILRVAVALGRRHMRDRRDETPAAAPRRRGPGGAALAADARGRWPTSRRSTATSCCSASAARWGRRWRGWRAAPRPSSASSPSPASATRPSRRRSRPQGVEPIRADLLDRAAIAGLPRVPNVILMAGHKFGTSDAPSRTWATNTILSGFVAEAMAGEPDRRVLDRQRLPVPARRLAAARREDEPLLPAPGDYAASCIGPRARAALVLRDARHAGPDLPAQLRDRPALRRAPRRRRARCATASPST